MYDKYFFHYILIPRCFGYDFRPEMEYLHITFNRFNYLVGFHPETLSDQSVEEQFEALLQVIDMQTDSFFIFTKANADTNGRIINQMMEAYVKKNPDKSALFASLGSMRYLSVMKQVTAVVGNSSSGILEAPSAHTATINIGDRQKGRIQAESIVNCSTQKEDILQAFQKVQSEEFRNKLNGITNPYGKGNASQQIIDIFKSMSVEKLRQKTFYDIR